MTLNRDRVSGAALVRIPLLWIAAFMLLPYTIIFTYSFWLKQYPTFVPALQFGKYLQLFSDPQYTGVLMRDAEGIAPGLAVLAASGVSVRLFPGLSLPERATPHLALPGRDRAALDQLSSAHLCLEDDPRHRGGSEFVPDERRHPVRAVVDLSLQPVRDGGDAHLHLHPLHGDADLHALEKIPPNLVEASADLGMRPLPTFLRVTLPLSMPGIAAVFTMTFCLSFGDFVAPFLVGEPDGNLVAIVIVTQFGTALNWPMGSALSIFVLVIVLTVLSISGRVEQGFSPKET